MNRGSPILNNNTQVDKISYAESQIETENEFTGKTNKFHRPTVRMDSKTTQSFQSYGTQTSDPALKNQPLRAHKVGENNGDVILRTEKEARVILVPEKEITVYERTGQPTILTVFLVAVIMILGAFLVYTLV